MRLRSLTPQTSIDSDFSYAFRSFLSRRIPAGVGDIAQLVNCLFAGIRLFDSPAPHKARWVIGYTCNPNIQELEAGGIRTSRSSSAALRVPAHTRLTAILTQINK